MVHKVTNSISISVETQYQPEHSSPLDNQYLFAYQITIQNKGEATVQLLTRHWFIFDAIGKHEQVKGDGVVGKQPILKPGEEFQYISACPLRSPMGYMKGIYTMQNINTSDQFQVAVPKFIMVATERKN
ncbi:MAG: Co2+/Mg2+ efflux protein ApaG [Saprospiraceae bacterium]|nr:Co2+/Mg2+ efflux protein ApaG [Saprospiraceae bacterium]